MTVHIPQARVLRQGKVVSRKRF